jgi:hypothetical protein
MASFAVALIFAAGCSGGESSNSSPAGLTAAGSGSSSSSASAATTSDLCKPLCTRTSSCDTDVDSETCIARCESKLKIDGKRSEFVNGVVACWNKLDCSEVLSANGLGDCVEEAAVTIVPTDTAKAFCNNLEDSLTKCDTGLAKAKCLDLTKIYADVTLDKAKKCTEKSCSNILPCVYATLDLSE